ncbi:uncharacterized protein LOC131069452 [Cryptomeria japonica]|uniref:uncharacterized protein LOC131069452 n=1 Tax=Cryptomeria japonica TaxID=3369 RepID=UPI0027DA53C4|nr:uncharacterized protein LOC131069452 [Cryptomeria japonica]
MIADALRVIHSFPKAWRENRGMKYSFLDKRLHNLTLQLVPPPLLPQCRRHQALTHYNSILQFQHLTSSRRGSLRKLDLRSSSCNNVHNFIHPQKGSILEQDNGVPYYLH